jgi:UDP-N-acetylglucosamine 4,6-dehydratase
MVFSLEGRSILITGGTGSFGKNMIRHLLKTNVARIVVYSRDELKQFDLKKELPSDSRLRFFLGDIRDKERLITAMKRIDYVVHAAALKQVDTGEYNPMEFVKTNVYGSQNVIAASIESEVEKVVALSTDKASSPINLYGATKLTADKLFVSANSYSNPNGTKFSVVRYGNVMGSRGSVIPLFLKIAKEKGTIPITDIRMTRFWITIEHAIEFVLESLQIMNGGELYVPKIPSMKITDLAQAIAPSCNIRETGIRPGEKLHEEMIALEDNRRTLEMDDRFVVAPVLPEWGYTNPVGNPVSEEFSYRSDTNTQWLSQTEIQRFIDSMNFHD